MVATTITQLSCIWVFLYTKNLILRFLYSPLTCVLSSVDIIVSRTKIRKVAPAQVSTSHQQTTATILREDCILSFRS